MFFQVKTDLPFQKMDTWTMTSLMIDESRMSYLKPGIGNNAQHIKESIFILFSVNRLFFGELIEIGKKTNNNYLYFVGGGENVFLLNLIPEYRDRNIFR